MKGSEARQKKFIAAVNALGLKFPVAEISKRTGESKGNVSSYISLKRLASENFLEKFYDAFADELIAVAKDQAAGSNPVQSPGITGSSPSGTTEDFKVKYIQLLEAQLKEANEQLTRSQEIAKKQTEIIDGSLKELLKKK